MENFFEDLTQILNQIRNENFILFIIDFFLNFLKSIQSLYYSIKWTFEDPHQKFR